MDFGIIAIIVLEILGIFMCFAPKLCTRADQRDNPDAVAKIKKFGIAIMVCAIAAFLLVLKFTLT